MAAKLRARRAYEPLVAVGYGVLSTVTGFAVGSVTAGVFGGESRVGRTLLFLAGMLAVGVLAYVAAGRVLERVLPGMPPAARSEPPQRQLRAVPDPR